MSAKQQIEARADALARRSIAEMYEDPFWQERFGARGREMADRDAQYHISYLLEALTANDASVLVNYARWLQTLLISRGMSSRHIAENFERLARAIRDEISEPEPALALLKAAVEALIYDAGPARELQRQASDLGRAVVDALEHSHTAWFAAASSYPSLAALESIENAERARFLAEVLDHVAYLADALHVSRPELFVQHAIWMNAFLVRRRAPAARVEQTLLTLRATLAAPPLPGLTPELVTLALPVLDAAIQALHGSAEPAPQEPGRT